MRQTPQVYEAVSHCMYNIILCRQIDKGFGLKLTRQLPDQFNIIYCHLLLLILNILNPSLTHTHAHTHTQTYRATRTLTLPSTRLHYFDDLPIPNAAAKAGQSDAEICQSLSAWTRENLLSPEYARSATDEDANKKVSEGQR